MTTVNAMASALSSPLGPHPLLSPLPLSINVSSDDADVDGPLFICSIVHRRLSLCSIVLFEQKRNKRPRRRFDPRLVARLPPQQNMKRQNGSTVTDLLFEGTHTT